jgi:hypothetical protein
MILALTDGFDFEASIYLLPQINAAPIFRAGGVREAL